MSFLLFGYLPLDPGNGKLSNFRKCGLISAVDVLLAISELTAADSPIMPTSFLPNVVYPRLCVFEEVVLLTRILKENQMKRMSKIQLPL